MCTLSKFCMFWLSVMLFSVTKSKSQKEIKFEDTYFTKCMVTVRWGGRWRGESHSKLNRHLSCHAPLTVHIYAAWSTGSSPLIYQKEKQENQEQKKNKKNKNESARVRMINFKEQVASHSLAKEGERCNLC